MVGWFMEVPNLVSRCIYYYEVIYPCYFMSIILVICGLYGCCFLRISVVIMLIMNMYYDSGDACLSSCF